MTPQEAIEYLRTFIDYEDTLHQISSGDFRIERMQRLLAAIGRPHEKLRAVHVAGSKGKGSTCAMIARILRAEGYRVGLYTSPHIHSFHERIRLLAEDRPSNPDTLFPDCITGEELAVLVEAYRDPIESLRDSKQFGRLTYYEVMTALALIFFALRKTDVVVLETGLGGRLDATNTVPAEIAVITPIGLEHTAILGETLTAIATEKAGIIKPGQSVVIAPQHPEAITVLERRCRLHGIQPLYTDPGMIESAAMDWHGLRVSLRTVKERYPDVEINLTGTHQQINALIAIQAIEALEGRGLPVSREAIYAGMNAVCWPVRFENIAQDPLVILDAAHSPESLWELRRTLGVLRKDQHVRVVFGASADKNIPAMCRVVREMADTVYLTAADHPRSYIFSEEEIVPCFGDSPVTIIDGVQQAVTAALDESDAGDIIIVTGSLFVASEARGMWSTVPRVPGAVGV